MPAGLTAARRDWTVALASSAALMLLAMALFRAPRPPPPAPAAAKLTIRVGQGGSSDALLNQEALFHDPTPLFLPTEWNSTPQSPRQEPDIAFRSYPPELTRDLQLNRPPPIPVPGSPGEALVANPPGNPLVGIGRTDSAVPVLPVRGAFVEIVAAGSGTPVYSRALADARPPTAAVWQPLEFMVEVDAAGLVGQPALTKGSEVEQVDAYFGGSDGYLTQNLRVGELLGPGFYRISVGP
jgi:hypothetical protein